VIAEGVEQEEQRLILDRLGCDGMQGFLFAKPVSQEEIAQALIAANHHANTEHKIARPSIRQPIVRQTRSLIA